MPSLRIPFPEKEKPSLVSFRAKRVTIGRLPDNTIQIPDRTVSAHHAEIIAENGHFRLHDLGATNGIQVNGQFVSDFHLTEACKLTIGGVECEFTPETLQEDEVDPANAVLTHAEAEALQQEVTALRTQLEAYQKECETLRQQHAATGGEATVSRAEFDRVTGELTAMTLKVVEGERDIEQLKTQIGVLSRDRQNLQKALDEARQNPLRSQSSADAVPGMAAEGMAAKEPQQPETLLPVPEAVGQSEPEVSIASAEESPADAESAAPTPAQTLPPPKPKPLFVPGSGAQPGTASSTPARAGATPRLPGQLQSAGIAGSGLRPAAFAKPAGAPTGNPGASTFQAKVGVPKAGVPQKPMAAVPRAVTPGAKPSVSAAGPKGTQKLS